MVEITSIIGNSLLILDQRNEFLQNIENDTISRSRSQAYLQRVGPR